MRLPLGLEGIRRLDERDDRAKLGLGRVGAHAHEDAAVLHDGAGKHVVTHGALDGKRLAGERRLVDHGASPLDHAIDGDGHAGANGHEVTGLKLRRRNAHLGVADDLLRPVRHVKQGVDELVFAHGTRVVLEQLADVQQEHRLPGRVDVALHERDANGGGIEHGHRQARLRQLA